MLHTISYPVCTLLSHYKNVIMMKGGNSSYKLTADIFPNSNVNSMSTIYCPSLSYLKRVFLYTENCNNTFAFHALSIIIVPLYNSNKGNFRVLNQY